jgi:hypothetical protein
LNGEAMPGAVEVDGGAEKVREPREPDEKPPPMRASADEIASAVGSASASTTAMVFTRLRLRCEKFMFVSQIPGRGKRP